VLMTAPLLLSDGSALLVTSAPHSLVWVANGAVLRQVELAHRIVGMPAEGADGRVVVLDENNTLHSYAPDGSARAEVQLSGRARSGALALNDGSIAVAIEQGAGSELAVVSPEFGSTRTLAVAGRIDRFLSRANDGSLWFNGNAGLVLLSGDDAVTSQFAWARNVIGGWALDDELFGMLVGVPPQGELRIVTRQGVVRQTLAVKESVFATGRGHLVLSRGLIPDPAAGAVAGTGATSNGAAGTTAAGTTPAVTRPTGPTATPPPPPLRAPTRHRMFGRYGWGAIAETPANTHTEFVLYDSRGRQISHAVIPLVNVSSVMLDPDDTMLVLTADGHAIAIDPGGVLRWNIELSTPVNRQPVALPTGGWMMVTNGSTPGVCTVRYP
jgi:hypothetical protein